MTFKICFLAIPVVAVAVAEFCLFSATLSRVLLKPVLNYSAQQRWTRWKCLGLGKEEPLTALRTARIRLLKPTKTPPKPSG